MLSILDCELEIVDDFMSSLLCLFFFWFACRMSIFKSVYIYIYTVYIWLPPTNVLLDSFEQKTHIVKTNHSVVTCLLTIQAQSKIYSSILHPMLGETVEIANLSLYDLEKSSHRFQLDTVCNRFSPVISMEASC